MRPDRPALTACPRPALAATGIFIPIVFLTTHERGASASSTPLAVLNAASILGRILPLVLSDRIGSYNTLTGTTLFAVVLSLALWLRAPGSDDGAGLAFAVLYGFASGAAIAVVTPCVARISDV